MLYGLTQFLPESWMSVYDILEFVLRIIVALLLGGIIGVERTHRQKEAGIRTHCMVALASALFMIVSKYAFLDVVEIGAVGGKGVDPSRIASQIVNGISFLGAGVIFKQGKSTIKGLTTAAGMWATAAVGMAVGAGLYIVGISVTAVMMLTQVFLHRHPIAHDAAVVQEINVSMLNQPELCEAFEALVKKHEIQIKESDIRRDGEMIHIHLSVRVDHPITHEEAVALLDAHEGISRISV